MKANCTKPGETVAIKLIEGIQDSEIQSRRVFREIRILRKLSLDINSEFSTKLIDIILPEGVL